MTEAERQAVEAAREAIKQFVRDELGVEIGHMPVAEGTMLVLDALIKIATRKP